MLNVTKRLWPDHANRNIPLFFSILLLLTLGCSCSCQWRFSEGALILHLTRNLTMGIRFLVSWFAKCGRSLKTNVKNTLSQSQFEANTRDQRETWGKMKASTHGFKLLLYLVPWENGTNFVKQSQRAVKQNQSKRSYILLTHNLLSQTLFS